MRNDDFFKFIKIKRYTQKVGNDVANVATTPSIYYAAACLVFTVFLLKQLNTRVAVI